MIHITKIFQRGVKRVKYQYELTLETTKSGILVLRKTVLSKKNEPQLLQETHMHANE